MTEKHLLLNREGLNVPAPQGNRIVRGEQSLVVLGEFDTRITNVPLYIVQNGNALGVVRLEHPEQMSLNEFKQKQSAHCMTEEERKKYLGEHMVLYAYEVYVIEAFDQPHKVDVPMSFNRHYIKGFSFSEELSETIESDTQALQTEIQTLIFDKEQFTKQQAVDWAKEHDFSASKVDEKETTWRIRQFNPDQCQRDTFRTISITDGVQGVICEPTSQSNNAQLRSLLQKLSQRKSAGFLLPSPTEVSEVGSAIENQSVSVEKKVHGIRVMLSKKDGEITVYDEHGKPLESSATPVSYITDESQLLSDADIVLDGYLCGDTVYVSDILYFNANCQFMPWKRRRDLLHNITNTEHIKKNPSVVVDSQEDLERAIAMTQRLPYSRGAIIKKMEEYYPRGDLSSAILSVKKQGGMHYEQRARSKGT